MNTSYYGGDNYVDKVSANDQIIKGEWWLRHRNIDNCTSDSPCSNNYSKHADEIRNIFIDYFMNKGKVSRGKYSKKLIVKNLYFLYNT